MGGPNECKLQKNRSKTQMQNNRGGKTTIRENNETKTYTQGNNRIKSPRGHCW